MDVATLEWLLTDAGRDLLEVAMVAYADAAGDHIRAATAVRKAEPDPERAAAALTQVELRTRGHSAARRRAPGGQARGGPTLERDRPGLRHRW